MLSLKKNISKLLIFLIVFQLFGWLMVEHTYSLEPSKSNNKTAQVPKNDYSKERVIVRFKPESWIKSASDIKGLSVWLANSQVQFFKNMNIWVVGVNNKLKNVDALKQELWASPFVEYVEYDYERSIVYTWVTTNDTHSINQWYLQSIQADDAWKMYDDTEDSTIVAVNDTWIDYTHSDLEWNLRDLSTTCKSDTGTTISWGCDNNGWNFEGNWDYDPATAVLWEDDPYDINGHGTHVAWIIWAVWNNGTWVIWVTQNTELIATRLESYHNNYWVFYISNLIRWLNFAVENGAKVVNASYWWTAFSSWEYDSINDAKSQGVLLVAAAWNSSNDNDGATKFYPANYDLDNIISVAAVWEDDVLASYSNYWATSVDVAAPGGDFEWDSWVYSTYNHSDVIWNHWLNDFVGITQTGSWLPWNIILGAAIESQSWAYNWDTTYTGSEDKTLIFDETFDLSWAKFAKFTGYFECEFTSGDDLEIIVNDEVVWNADVYWTYARSLSYGYVDVPIPSHLYSSGSQLKARFVTNGDTNYDFGCTLDDFSITRYDDNQNTYIASQWTSMAAPVVSWLAAMLWSYKPDITYSEVKDIILTSVESIAPLSWKVATDGKINAKNAIQELISRYGISKSGTFEWELFNAPNIDLDGKNVVFSWSILDITGTWTVINMSGSTLWWSGMIQLWVWLDASAFSTSNDFTTLVKKASWEEISTFWETVYGESILVSYTGTVSGTGVKVRVKKNETYIYDDILTSDIEIPLGSSFSWEISTYVYAQWAESIGIQSGITLEIVDTLNVAEMDFIYTPAVFTGTLDFNSWEVTNSTGTYIHLASTHYPVDYIVYWDAIETYTWTLESAQDVFVILTTWDETKTLSGVLTNVADQDSSEFWSSITLNTSGPWVPFNVEFNENNPINISNSWNIILQWSWSVAASGATVIYNISDTSTGSLWGTGGVVNNSFFIENLDISHFTDGEILYDVKFVDTNGFTWSIYSATWYMDTSSPIATLLMDSITNSTWVTIDLSSSEYSVEYVLSWSIVWTTTGTLSESWSIVIELTPWDAIKVISVQYTDMTGNIWDIFTGSIQLDQSAPEVDLWASVSTWSSSKSIDFTLSTSDEDFDVSSIEWSNNKDISGEAIWTGYTLDGETATGIIVTAVYWDILGNTGSISLWEFELDNQWPEEPTNVIVNGWEVINLSNSGSVTISGSGSDWSNTVSYSLEDTGTGIVSGTGTMSGTNFEITWIDASLLADGEIYYSVYLLDSLGNTWDVVTGSILKDTIPLTWDIILDQYTNNTWITVRLEASQYPVDYELWGDIEGTYTWTIWWADDITIEITSEDEAKVISVQYTFSGTKVSDTYTGWILLDQTVSSVILTELSSTWVAHQNIDFSLSSEDQYFDSGSVVWSNNQDSNTWAGLSYSLWTHTASGVIVTAIYADIFGNTGSVTSNEFILDNTAPSAPTNVVWTSDYINLTNSGSFSVIWSWSEENLTLYWEIEYINYVQYWSWINSNSPWVWYSVFTWSWDNSNLSFTQSLDMSWYVDVEYIYELWFEDSAWNMSEIVTWSLMKDTDPPTWYLYYDNSPTSSWVELTVNMPFAVDSTWDYELIWDFVWSPISKRMTVVDDILNLTFTPGDGYKNFSVQFTDLAWNDSTVTTGSILHDTTPPIVMFSSHYDWETVEDAYINFTWSISDTFLSIYYLKINNIWAGIKSDWTWDSAHVFPLELGNNTFTYEASDYIGNTRTWSIDIYRNIDSVTPESFSGSQSFSGWIELSGSGYTSSWATFTGSWSFTLKSEEGHKVKFITPMTISASWSFDWILNAPKKVTFTGSSDTSNCTTLSGETYDLWSSSNHLTFSWNTAQVTLSLSGNHLSKNLCISTSIDNWLTFQNQFVSGIASSLSWSYTFISFQTSWASLFAVWEVVEEEEETTTTTRSSWGGGGWSSYPTCQDQWLECRAVAGSETLYKWYKKDGFTCRGWNLWTTCSKDEVVTKIYRPKFQTIKDLESDLEIENSILKRIYNSKKYHLLKLQADLLKLDYLWEDIEAIKSEFSQLFSQWIESLHAVEKYLNQKDIDAVRKEIRKFLVIYEKMRKLLDGLEVRVIKIDGEEMKYVRYTHGTIQRIQNMILNNIKKKQSNKEVYSYANRVVHNLNILVTHTDLTKDEIKDLREKTIELYKLYLKEYRKLPNK